jgi:hypothetical protein
MTAAQAFVQSIGINRTAYTLLGEVISWNLPENTIVSFAQLKQALLVAGLDEKIAREMLPRHAFARAAKQLAQERIIRCTEDSGHTMKFQFTREYLNTASGQFVYDYETTLQLDKDTGAVQPDYSVPVGGHSSDLARQAQQLLDKARQERTTADITRYIMTLFSKQADLFPVRNAGGVYFVPEQHIGFVDKVETLLTALNGTVTRFPVPAGTKQGDKSVRDAVQQGLQTLIDEHLKAVDEFGTDTRPSTIERAARKIEEAKFKIESYAMYLEDESQKLNASLAAVSVTLRQKMEQVLAAKASTKVTAEGLLE